MPVSSPTQPKPVKVSRKKANSVPPLPGTSLITPAQDAVSGAGGSQSQPLTPLRLPAIHFDTTLEQIAKFKAKAATVKFDSSAEYERGRVFLGELRTTRTSVDKRRKELKAEPLKYLEQVEGDAQILIGGIKAIETPLLQAKQVIDDEEALERVRKANAERERIEAEAREKLRAEQEEARKQQEEWAEYRAEEEARIKAEQEKLAESRRQLEEKEREVEKEKERVRAEAAKTSAQPEPVRGEVARQAKQITEPETKSEPASSELNHDVITVHAYAALLRATLPGCVQSESANAALDKALDQIEVIVKELEEFAGE